MSYQDQFDELIKQNKGLVLTSEVDGENLSRHYLSRLVLEKKLERVARGVYLSPEAFDDEMFRLQLKNQRIIFSHETALYLHDLTDRDPARWSVTVPYGYNASHLRKKGIDVHSVKKEQYLLGVSEGVTMFGRPIKIYDRERTICDLARNRNNMDIGVFNDALKRYVSLKDKNIPLLLRYADQLGIQKNMKNYLEILL